MADTRAKLLDGALQTIRSHGIAGVSARTVAATAGVNQALVFYHFGSLDNLLTEACLEATRGRVQRYRTGLAGVASLRELLELGRSLHDEERGLGNVAVLAQLLAGAQTDARLAEPVRAALNLWVAEVETVLRRLLADTPLADLADPAGLARAVSAAFIGLELFEGVDADGARAALDALDQLAAIVEVVEDLGPVARRALRAKLRRRPAPPERRARVTPTAPPIGCSGNRQKPFLLQNAQSTQRCRVSIGSSAHRTPRRPPPRATPGRRRRRSSPSVCRGTLFNKKGQ